MTSSLVRLLPARCLALGLALVAVFAGETIRAQSDVVFMTMDPQGGASRLVRFDAGTETFSTNAAPSDAFLGVTILNGDVLVSEYNTDVIRRFAPDGTNLGVFASPALPPTFLESDSSGNVYTTPFSIGPAVATRFDSSGMATGTFVGGNQFAGIDADAAGNVYIANNAGLGSALLKFAANGTPLNSVPLSSSARDFAIDEAANLLYVAVEGAFGNGIQIFDISGAAPSFLGSMATPANANLVGVHFAAESGNILATDFGLPSNDPRGLEFSSGGTLLAEYRPAGAFITWDITNFVVPEPGSTVLLFAGLLTLGVNARRRRPA